MPEKLPAIKGNQLIKLLEQDGYCVARRSKHGVRLYKKLPGRTIVTVIATKNAALPERTLGDILSVKQTGLRKSRLRRLIEEYGLP